MVHPDTRPTSFTCPPVADMRVVPLHSLFLYSDSPYPVTLLPIGSDYFRSKPFPVQISQHFSNLVIRLAFRMRYACRTSCGGSGGSRGTPLWKPMSTVCRGRLPAGLMSGGTPVECDTRIPRSRRPITVEDDQTGDESSYSVSTPGHLGRNRSLRLWESRSPCRQSGDSVSAVDRFFGPDRYWDGWRGA